MENNKFGQGNKKNQIDHKKPAREAQHGLGQAKILNGKIKAAKANVAFFVSDDYKTEVEIPIRELKTAIVGDKVEVKILGKNRFGKLEGEVIKILSRAKNFFVGVVEKTPKGTFVIPDDKRSKVIIKLEDHEKSADLVASEKYKNLKDLDKVRVKMSSWKLAPDFSTGEVVNVLGKKGDNSTEMNSIAVDKGFDIDFPESVLKESRDIFNRKGEIMKEELAKRKDLRDTLTFTIDPKTAKDFDDAISFKKLPNGNFEIGVHIADVSHYVKEGSELDKEAFKRGCSVYLPDRTIPMLPFELSDDLCSLNENEEKLAFSAIFEMDSHGKIFSKWFGKSVIKSDKRFTYESAQETIDRKSGEHFLELDTLNKLAKVMRKEKWQKGAINFERDEIAFEFDASGKPVRIYKKAPLDTHKLVEEYMLLANKEVAEFVYKHEKKTGKIFPLPYRIHDFPDKEKIEELSVFVKALGHELVIGKNGSITGKDMQALFAQVEGKAEEALVKTAAIRSMSKAIYSVKNIGHFGLAFEYYAHFTSPIRRYPDMLVHRMVYKILSETAVDKNSYAYYEKACMHSTDQEIKAAEAERNSKKYKQIEYMLNHIGETFDGTITGVTEWGIYAEEAETLAEGMIKLSSLGNDFYVLNAKNYEIVGQKTKKKFSLGQKVKIKLISADLDRRVMDWEIVE